MTVKQLMKMLPRPLRLKTRGWASSLLSKLSIAKSQFRGRKSAIPPKFMRQIADRTYAYKYEGLRCWKNPFDLALYTLLLSELRPALIIEIGSERGGSAKWFSNQLAGLDVKGQVLSYDIRPVLGVASERLEFQFGNIFDLESTDIAERVASVAGPVLVVEDGPHTYEGCLASLKFFEGVLRKGDYYVVEDGNLEALGFHSLKNGPRRAIQDALAVSSRFEIDYRLCDFFGQNVTWNENGWLRVVR